MKFPWENFDLNDDMVIAALAVTLAWLITSALRTWWG